MSGPAQILSDCPHCLVEAALVEICEADAPALAGALVQTGALLQTGAIVIESQCRLCGFATERGRVRTPPRRFRAAADVVAALSSWATEDGDSDVEHFCLVNFFGQPADAVAARILARERVETGFDVIAFLFPQAALATPWLRRGERAAVDRRVVVLSEGSISGGGEAPPQRPPRIGPPDLRPTLTILPWEEPPEVTGRAEAPPRRVETARLARETPPFDPADITRAFWSVILADADLHPREDRLLAQLLPRFGAPTLPPAEARMYRPGELGRPPDPAPVLAAMEQLARCDGVLDRSEVRVLREFARAWGVGIDEARLRPPSVWAEAWAGFTGGRA